MHTVQESTVNTLSRAISIDHSRSAYMFITPVRASDRLRPTRYYNRLCRCRLLSFPPKQWSPFTLACNISRVVGHISLRTRRHDRWGAWGVIHCRTTEECIYRIMHLRTITWNPALNVLLTVRAYNLTLKLLLSVLFQFCWSTGDSKLQN